MKLLGKNIEKNGEGTVKLLPQDEEDMWLVYNLVAVGDHITTSSFRKVTKETSTGSSSSTKVKITLTIDVQDIQYDPSNFGMRLKGKNIQENQVVKLGAYHTLELGVTKTFTIFKSSWDSIFLDLLASACNPTKTAEVAAIVMQPGLAHLCLITNHTTLVRSKIEVSIPRKRVGSTDRHGKGIQRFFQACLEAIIRNVDFKVVKCFIIAGPAFVKNDFYDFMYAEAIKRDLKILIENKSKVLLVAAASGYKHALTEVMMDPAVTSRISDTKACNEVAKLAKFFELLNSDPDRAFYGPQHVRAANEAKAISTLLVTDSLFRAADPATRKDYIKLVEECKENGGDVLVFSGSHVSGQQLAQISGVAALLRFPIPDMACFEGEEDSEDDEQTP